MMVTGFDDRRQGTEQYDQEVENTPLNEERMVEALNWQPPQGATLDGQADPDDDLNRKWAIYRHLEVVVEMASSRKHLQGRFSNSASTTVATSVPSPRFSAFLKGRSASSFHTYSLRWCFWRTTKRTFDLVSKRVNVDLLDEHWRCFCRLLWLICLHPRMQATICVQVDVLDSLQPRHPTSILGKRLRRAVDCFGQLSPRCAGDTSGGNELPQVKKLIGVRFRDNKYWVAEVKPPRGNAKKVHIGQFKTQTEAARARDVACYLYHGRYNFEDTPQIISMLLTSAGRNAEDELSKFSALDDGDKLKIVKDLAKRIAEAQAGRLPSTHLRNPTTMRTNMRTDKALHCGHGSFQPVTDISQNVVQIVEVAQDCVFESRRSAVEQSEVPETTSKFSGSRINEAGGTRTMDAEQSQLFETEGWLDSVILEDPSTVQLRSPHDCQTDLTDRPLDQSPVHSDPSSRLITDEASELMAPEHGGFITDFTEGQDVWQRSVEHAAGDSSGALTNLEIFGNIDYANPVTMFLAGSPSQV